MANPIITLTTDFGQSSPYVAAMKGVVLGSNPEARILDLSHQIPPQDVRHADHFLTGAIPYFPPGVIHVVVVDPGVGTERSLLYVELGGHQLLLPDNGCWTMLAQKIGAAAVVRQLNECRFWREAVSNTFHGRDILAPVAAHLSLGIDPALLGPTTMTWAQLDYPQPRRHTKGVDGVVAHVDGFGNLISNVPAGLLTQPPQQLRIAGRKRRFRSVRTYGEAEAGELILLTSSSGYLEVAVAAGSAARRLQASAGDDIRLRYHKPGKTEKNKHRS